MTKWLLVIVALLFLHPVLLVRANGDDGKQIRFQRFTSEEGLSQNTVYCILQDQQGFIWFGTDEGLNRFDGYSFKIYQNTPFDNKTLSSNKIYALFEDRAGTLWIGTRQGLNSLDRTRKRFEHYRHDSQNPGSLGNDMVKAIYEDHTGALWVGSTGGGLNLLDRATGLFTVYLHDERDPNSISTNNVRTIFEDRNGTLWIGTDGGLDRFDRSSGHFTHYRHNPAVLESLSYDNVNAIYEDETQNLWIGTDGGLNIFDRTRGNFTRRALNQSAGASEMITAIFRDQSGAVWIGTDSGLHRYDSHNGEIAAYLHAPKDPVSLGSNRVSAICQDRSGALWVGTYFGGANRFDPLSWRFASYLADPDNANNLSKNVWSLCLDHTGTLWIGTNDGLIEMDRNSGKTEIYRHNPNDPYSLRSSHIDALIEDRTGTLWVGSNGGGLSSFDRATKRFTAYTYNANDPFSISSNKVRALFIDREGTLWIGTLGGGLNRYDKASGRFYAYRHDGNDPSSISGDFARAFCEDSAGNLWVGTESGLNRFDRKSSRFISYRHSPDNPYSISSDFIIYIQIDHKGILWVGTAGGLNRLDAGNGHFTSLTVADGLANNSINGILEDNNSTLWLGTNRGLTSYDPVTGSLKNFDTRDGLQCREYNGRACFRSPSGEIFFGGNNGFTSFYGEKIKENDYIPPVLITSIKLFDKPLEKADAWLIPDTKEAATPLVLSYNENFLSFEFSAMNYQLPERNQYAYMMAGIDNDWVVAKTRRYANYSKIPPGEYTFKVKGSNNDGRWNEKGIAIRIIITPPFWKTRTAYLFYLLLAVGIIYGGIKYRLRSLHKRNLVLETTVEKRTAELAAALSEIKTKNSELICAKEAMENKNVLLDEKISELISSQKQADRIFSALAEALPGTVLEEKYRLEERIGVGGFGAVYRATHLMLEREVAIKVFKPVPGNDSAENLARFRFEAISTCRINHPNAVAVLDSGISAEGIAYLVMELLQGETLKEELRCSRRLTLPRCAQILLSVSQVLEKAHSLGIIHRDIKPDNIFLHQEGGKEIIKILDFGIAKLVEQKENPQGENFTAPGKLIGTPAYISPERFAGLPYDGKSDIYSLGVMLYEMLSGKTPFPQRSPGMLGIIQMQMQGEAAPLSNIVPEVSSEISEIVASALARNPSARPNAGELSRRFLAAINIEPEELIDAKGYCLPGFDSSFFEDEKYEENFISEFSHSTEE